MASVSDAAISDSGQIVVNDLDNMYFQTDNSYTEVTVPGGTGAINPLNIAGINDAGDVVGYEYTPSSTQSFFRDASGNYQTIYVPGSVYTEALGLNDLNQVVGSYYDGTNSYGFLWSGGIFTTLTEPGEAYTVATGINDAGDIVGFATNNGFTDEGFLALPTPEPTTLAATFIGLLGLSLLARLRRLPPNPEESAFSPR